MDEALLEQQREAYKVHGVDEDEPAAAKHQQKKKKRKQPVDGDEVSPAYSTIKTSELSSKTDGVLGFVWNKQNSSNSTSSHKAKKLRVNTAIYVTSIPLNATVDEIHDLFCKCGVIAEEIDRGRPRIKMYTDENGNFKGDALVVYFRPESVNLAVQMLDDSDFRFGETGPQGKKRVQAADFSFKAQQEVPIKPNMRDKKKIMRKTQKLNKFVSPNRFSPCYYVPLAPLFVIDTNGRVMETIASWQTGTMMTLRSSRKILLDGKELSF